MRFPTTLGGSRALAGTFDPAAFAATDADGTSLADALRAWGGEPEAVADLARRPEEVLGYLGVHIEQGPVLKELGLPVGIVTAISGASRFRVELQGSAGHAGTVPMALLDLLGTEAGHSTSPHPGTNRPTGHLSR